eukprot:tig00020563_g11290.t1
MHKGRAAVRKAPFPADRQALKALCQAITGDGSVSGSTAAAAAQKLEETFRVLQESLKSKSASATLVAFAESDNAASSSSESSRFLFAWCKYLAEHISSEVANSKKDGGSSCSCGVAFSIQARALHRGTLHQLIDEVVAESRMRTRTSTWFEALRDKLGRLRKDGSGPVELLLTIERRAGDESSSRPAEGKVEHRLLYAVSFRKEGQGTSVDTLLQSLGLCADADGDAGKISNSLDRESEKPVSSPLRANFFSFLARHRAQLEVQVFILLGSDKQLDKALLDASSAAPDHDVRDHEQHKQSRAVPAAGSSSSQVRSVEKENDRDAGDDRELRLEQLQGRAIATSPRRFGRQPTPWLRHPPSQTPAPVAPLSSTPPDSALSSATPYPPWPAGPAAAAAAAAPASPAETPGPVAQLFHRASTGSAASADPDPDLDPDQPAADREADDVDMPLASFEIEAGAGRAHDREQLQPEAAAACVGAPAPASDLEVSDRAHQQRQLPLQPQPQLEAAGAAAVDMDFLQVNQERATDRDHDGLGIGIDEPDSGLEAASGNDHGYGLQLEAASASHFFAAPAAASRPTLRRESRSAGACVAVPSAPTDADIDPEPSAPRPRASAAAPSISLPDPEPDQNLQLPALVGRPSFRGRPSSSSSSRPAAAAGPGPAAAGPTAVQKPRPCTTSALLSATRDAESLSDEEDEEEEALSLAERVALRSLQRPAAAAAVPVAAVAGGAHGEVGGEAPVDVHPQLPPAPAPQPPAATPQLPSAAQPPAATHVQPEPRSRSTLVRESSGGSSSGEGRAGDAHPRPAKRTRGDGDRAQCSAGSGEAEVKREARQRRPVQRFEFSPKKEREDSPAATPAPGRGRGRKRRTAPGRMETADEEAPFVAATPEEMRGLLLACEEHVALGSSAWIQSREGWRQRVASASSEDGLLLLLGELARAALQDPELGPKLKLDEGVKRAANPPENAARRAKMARGRKLDAGTHDLKYAVCGALGRRAYPVWVATAAGRRVLPGWPLGAMVHAILDVDFETQWDAVGEEWRVRRVPWIEALLAAQSERELRALLKELAGSVRGRLGERSSGLDEVINYEPVPEFEGEELEAGTGTSIFEAPGPGRFGFVAIAIGVPRRPRPRPRPRRRPSSLAAALARLHRCVDFDFQVVSRHILTFCFKAPRPRPAAAARRSTGTGTGARLHVDARAGAGGAGCGSRGRKNSAPTPRSGSRSGGHVHRVRFTESEFAIDDRESPRPPPAAVAGPSSQPGSHVRAAAAACSRRPAAGADLKLATSVHAYLAKKLTDSGYSEGEADASAASFAARVPNLRVLESLVRAAAQPAKLIADPSARMEKLTERLKGALHNLEAGLDSLKVALLAADLADDFEGVLQLQA